VTTEFVTTSLPARADAIAPDGSEVRLLPRLARGGMAHFTLAAGMTSRAVEHRTVEEIWYCVRGRGEMWRSANGREEIVTLAPGVAITIPLGTRFQFRALGDEPFSAVGVTMPPWPGDDEAFVVAGPWEPTT
jgi:mannose-6-phosphate isomerase-like protein (cupin superfamily)